jgi:hypothetical protein
MLACSQMQILPIGPDFGIPHLHSWIMVYEHTIDQLHNEKFHNFHSLLNITWAITSISLRCAGHVACNEETIREMRQILKWILKRRKKRKETHKLFYGISKPISVDMHLNGLLIYH